MGIRSYDRCQETSRVDDGVLGDGVMASVLGGIFGRRGNGERRQA